MHWQFMRFRRRIHPAGETNVATHRCAVHIFLDKIEEKTRQSFAVNSHVVRTVRAICTSFSSVDLMFSFSNCRIIQQFSKQSNVLNGFF
jgi:hypothetical protein